MKSLALTALREKNHYKGEKIQKQRERIQVKLYRLQTFMENNFASKDMTKALDEIVAYISDLELEIEINKTLAEQERDYEK